MALALFLFGSASPETLAQTRRTPPRPTARVGRLHRSIVQARNPHWRAVTIAANRQAAHIIKYNLIRRGYQVRLRPQLGGRVVVLARMMHWHTVGVYTNRHLANHVAAMLRARGMHARVLGH
jgi:hypothetical protein